MLIAACGYATVALFGKWIFLHQLPMYFILTWRFGGAALFFFVFSHIQRYRPLTSKEKWKCFLLGLFGDVPQTTFFFFAVDKAGASIAALLLYTFPLFVFLLQSFYFKQKTSLWQWLSLGIALIGVFLIIPSDGVGLNIEGVFYGLATAIIYACYLSFGAHYTKTLPVPRASSYLTSGAFGGFALLAIFSGEGLVASFSWSASIIILGIITIATIIPLVFLLRGMQLLGATQASLLFTFEPVVTVILAILLFQEPVTFQIITGSLLILVSACILQGKKSSVSKINNEI